MSRVYSKSEPDSDDSDSGNNAKKNRQPTRSINELLVRALETAANPGFGDEEPEVMEAPSVEGASNDSKRSGEQDSKGSPDAKHSRTDADEEERRLALRARQIAEEERKAAEMQVKHSSELAVGDDEMLDDSPSEAAEENMRERAKYIPLRLTYEERKNLRMVNAAINVSDYTTAVDVPFTNKARRHHVQLQHIVAFLTGIIAAKDYDRGQQVLEDRNFVPYAELIAAMLEIARRYKITNPEKMRSEYGKLVFLMQDAVSENTLPLIGVNIHQPVKTVHDLLRDAKGLALLDDPLLPIASAEILPDKEKSRGEIQHMIRRKERAAEHLVRKYTSRTLSSDAIRACLYSFSDNNSFLNSNRKPVLDCIALLKQYFSPSNVEEGYSLSIDEGLSGSRLSHSHELQYNYVLQSLTLWSTILRDMFRLWYLAEQDLLSPTSPYELRNTGQGLQRVQQSPRVFRAMHEILAQTKAELGGWVGSSVIHLGDHNVPNTLMFIDKYTQVSRILGPLITTLNNLEAACQESEGLARYLKAFGGIEKARKDILHDFFTHAFDGSGGDNFFDAGSCIDGRLTSAWNWCSQLSEKPYYPLFRMTGFLSFDGQFEK
jgi:hypothetical protein